MEGSEMEERTKIGKRKIGKDKGKGRMGKDE